MCPRYTFSKFHLALLLERSTAKDSLLHLPALKAQTASDLVFDCFSRLSLSVSYSTSRFWRTSWFLIAQNGTLCFSSPVSPCFASTPTSWFLWRSVIKIVATFWRVLTLVMIVKFFMLQDLPVSHIYFKDWAFKQERSEELSQTRLFSKMPPPMMNMRYEVLHYIGP